jgi:hypothetical protein
LLSSSLATFNKKVRCIMSGEIIEDEDEDELPPSDIIVNAEDDS